jgi:hypothetical protein
MEYEVGSVIEYKAFGEVRTVTVANRYTDIKNGRPGFDGRCYVREGGIGPLYMSVWGYDSQITRVIRA